MELDIEQDDNNLGGNPTGVPADIQALAQLHRPNTPVAPEVPQVPTQDTQAVPTQEPEVTQEVAPQEQVETAQEQEVEPFSLGEGFSHAFENETLTGFALRQFGNEEFAPDPNLHLTVNDFDERYPDIPEDLRHHLYEGESEAEIEHIATNLRKRLDDQARFDALNPVEQIGLILASSVVDAPALAISALAGAVTGGATTAVALGKIGITGKRISRIVGGVVGGGAEAAIHEAILATDDPLKNDDTVLLAGLTGIAFGAAGGEIGHRIVESRFKKAAAKDAESLRDKIIQDAAEKVTGKRKLPEVSSTAEDLTAVDRLYDPNKLPDPEPLRKLGIDVTSELKRSKDPGFQKLGTFLGEDGIFGGGTTAAIEYEIRTTPVLANGTRALRENYDAYAKNAGLNKVRRSLDIDRLKFNEEVGREVRKGFETNAAPEVKKAANAYRKALADMLQVAKDSGLKGFDDIEESSTYLTRQYSSNNILKVQEKHNKDAVLNVITGALRAGDDRLDEAVAAKIAKGIYVRGTTRTSPSGHKLTTVITNDLTNELTDILQASDVEGDDIKKIIDQLKDRTPSEISVTKSRLNIDENYVDPVTGIAFTDLLENNVEKLLVNYARSVGGASAVAKFGFDTPQSLFNHIDKVKQDAINNRTLTPTQADGAYERAINVANQVLGRPNTKPTTFARTAQLFEDYAYLTSSGGFLAASIPEATIATAENGFRATLKGSPILRKFLKDIESNVSPDQDIMNVVESMGIGRQYDLSLSSIRTDEDDALQAVKSGFVNKLTAAKRSAGLLSGLPQFTRYTQQIAGRSAIQSLADLATKGDVVEITKRLKQFGFENEQQLSDVLVGLKKHATFRKNTLFKGETVAAIDMEAWRLDDPAAVARFETSIVRQVNHQIQLQLPGENNILTPNPVFKLMTQFMGFPIAAYGKKSLNALHRRDVQTATAVALSTATAVMVYAARMYAASAVQDDPEEFLKERLDPQNLVKVGIQRSGFASILPRMLDSVLDFTRRTGITETGPIFDDRARTSGLSTGGATSTPAGQSVVNVAKTVGLARKVVTGEEVLERDVRSVTNLAPLRRLPGINLLYESYINSFPEKKNER